VCGELRKRFCLPSNTCRSGSSTNIENKHVQPTGEEKSATIATTFFEGWAAEK
jgi:hypothetical protein